MNLGMSIIPYKEKFPKYLFQKSEIKNKSTVAFISQQKSNIQMMSSLFLRVIVCQDVFKL